MVIDRFGCQIVEFYPFQKMKTLVVFISLEKGKSNIYISFLIHYMLVLLHECVVLNMVCICH